MPDSPPGPFDAAQPRAWLPVAAFAFVLVALVALVATPTLLLNSIVRTTTAITDDALPAYGGLRDFAFATEHRVTASRSRFLSNAPRYDRQLEEARVRERDALRRLEVLAPRFGRRAEAHLDAIREYAARRDALEASVIAGGSTIDAYRESIPEFDALRDSMIIEVTGLQRELMSATEQLVREEIRLAELQRTVSVVLGVAAALAALLVGWFAWQQARLRRRIEQAFDEATHNRELAERRTRELEGATESRVRLLRGITHDVKNPLGAARGYADLLAMGVKGPVSPEQEPLVTGIRRSVDTALTIIADLLELARSDSGALAVHLVEADVRELARRAVDDHRVRADAAGLAMQIEVPESPLPVLTDPARVDQVIGNLLSNAIKYTPAPGRITVRCRRSPGRRTSDVDRAVVEVSDTGPGIPVAQREAIFDEFTRLEEDGAQKGHGLGLAIARRIARTLGGELSLAEPGAAGATFVLALPLTETKR